MPSADSKKIGSHSSLKLEERAVRDQGRRHQAQRVSANVQFFAARPDA
jgi:hypothetical protein